MFSLIVATLGTRIPELERLLSSLENQTYKNFEVIMVVQDNFGKVSDTLEKYQDMNIKEVQISEKGLSNARNIGLQYAEGTYVTFSDDDCWYPADGLSIVKDKIDDFDICCYKFFDPMLKQYQKKYPEAPQRELSYFDLAKKSSIEIFINLKRVSKKDTKFDINFGVGSKYPTGEENIFLCDMKRKKYTIAYEPEVVVYHPCDLSTDSTIEPINWSYRTIILKRMYNSTFLAFFIYLYITLRRRRNIKKPFYSLIRGISYLMKTNE